MMIKQFLNECCNAKGNSPYKVAMHIKLTVQHFVATSYLAIGYSKLELVTYDKGSHKCMNPVSCYIIVQCLWNDINRTL